MFPLKSSRPGRQYRRPDLEFLEHRQLLTASTPKVAGAVSYLNADGSVNADAVTQASTARATFGVDGSGGNVAVIDTGVDYRNSAFGTGGVGSGQNKVIAGVDFTGSPNGVLPTWQHGTAVAGLIASTDPSHPGVAPGSGIVALRVFGDNNQGSFDSIAKALAWVQQNHAQYNITAVNLSVADNNNYQSNVFANDFGVGQQITQSVQALDAINIPVVVAAGNSFDGKTQGEGFAAIVPNTISVTATDETKMTNGNDPLASDAQRLGAAKGGASATDIAAPGVNIVAPSGPSGTLSYEGTSFATPQVTGTILLLQQMYRQAYGGLPTVTQLDSWLTDGAASIHDNVTGIDLGRLNTLGSLKVLSSQIAAKAASEVVVAPPTITNPGLDSQVVTTPVVSPSTNPTVNPTLTPQPMTELIVNGSSVGSVATSQLASGFKRLLALTGGAAKTLRAWAPPGSVVDLGTVRPSGGHVQSQALDQPNHTKAKAKVQTGHAQPIVGRAVPRIARPTLAQRLRG